MTRDIKAALVHVTWQPKACSGYARYSIFCAGRLDQCAVSRLSRAITPPSCRKAARSRRFRRHAMCSLVPPACAAVGWLKEMLNADERSLVFFSAAHRTSISQRMTLSTVSAPVRLRQRRTRSQTEMKFTLYRLSTQCNVLGRKQTCRWQQCNVPEGAFVQEISLP